MASESKTRSPIGLILSTLIALALAGGVVYFLNENKKLLASVEEKDGRIAEQAVAMTNHTEAHKTEIAELERTLDCCYCLQHSLRHNYKGHGHFGPLARPRRGGSDKHRTSEFDIAVFYFCDRSGKAQFSSVSPRRSFC